MADKRNLIFICTDQQRTDTMPCYGNDWIETPHLNGLSDSGFVFENAYVAQAVCTPARATMLTGLYPHSAGAIKNSSPDRPLSGLAPDVKTIAESRDTSDPSRPGNVNRRSVHLPSDGISHPPGISPCGHRSGRQVHQNPLHVPERVLAGQLDRVAHRHEFGHD